MKVFLKSPNIYYPDGISTQSPKDGKRNCIFENAGMLSNRADSLAAFNIPFVHKADRITNLEKYAAGDLRTPSQVETILKQYPQTGRFMGSIPFNWMKDVKKEEIPERTNQIFDLFANFARSVTCARNNHHSNYKKQMDECALNLEKLTGERTKMEYLGEGTIGRTYKLSVGEENFVVKTFFTNPVGLGYYTRHGKGAEILSAVYAKYNAPKGYFADFYFGKFAKKDDFDGFMVTKFIDYDTAKTSYVKNMMLDKMTEHPVVCGNLVNNNSVLDTVVDYGEITKGGLANNRQYKIQRLIVSALLSEDVERFNNICKQYEGSDLDNVLNGLSKSFSLVSLCCYDDVTSLGEDEIKIVTSDKHNRMFKMIFSALLDNNNQLYEDIVKKNHGKTEFEYVIRIFNKNMTAEEREIFARRVRKTELEKLSNMLSKTGII